MKEKYVFCFLTIFLSYLGIRAGQEGWLLAHYDGFAITFAVSIAIMIGSIVWLVREFLIWLKGRLMFYVIEYDGGDMEIGRFTNFEDALSFAKRYINDQMERDNYWYVDGISIEDATGKELWFRKCR